MARFQTELDDRLREFIAAQHIFFTASAPVEGRINLSPKGLDSFRVLSPTRVGYLDLTGSENETAAHIAENGRVTLMFCSFEGKPLIVRLYGQGQVVRPQDPDWGNLHTHFPTYPGERQIVLLNIESIMSTCGFAVPLYKYRGERDDLIDFATNMGPEKMDDYRRRKNQQSIDGLPTHLFEETPR
jgi:hypothetical protein